MMNDNGKLQDDVRICSPVQLPVQPMIVNNYYAVTKEQFEQAIGGSEIRIEDDKSMVSGLVWVLLIIAIMGFVCFGWEMFQP